MWRGVWAYNSMLWLHKHKRKMLCWAQKYIKDYYKCQQYPKNDFVSITALWYGTYTSEYTFCTIHVQLASDNCAMGTNWWHGYWFNYLNTTYWCPIKYSWNKANSKGATCILHYTIIPPRWNPSTWSLMSKLIEFQVYWQERLSIVWHHVFGQYLLLSKLLSNTITMATVSSLPGSVAKPNRLDCQRHHCTYACAWRGFSCKRTVCGSQGISTALSRCGRQDVPWGRENSWNLSGIWCSGEDRCHDVDSRVSLGLSDSQTLRRRMSICTATQTHWFLETLPGCLRLFQVPRKK